MKSILAYTVTVVNRVYSGLGENFLAMLFVLSPRKVVWTIATAISSPRLSMFEFGVLSSPRKSTWDYSGYTSSPRKSLWFVANDQYYTIFYPTLGV